MQIGVQLLLAIPSRRAKNAYSDSVSDVDM